MNYTVFDVETANSSRASICSIGIIRYENNRVVFEDEILINPETEFNYFNIRVHGIESSDVADAPTFPEIWPHISKYFDKTVLIAHNAKSMDLCALYRTLERYNLPLVDNQYICTMELAKEIFRNDDRVGSYKLDVLSRFLDVDLFHHHDALEDTRACLQIFQKFFEMDPSIVTAQPYKYKSSNMCSSSGNSFESIYCDRTRKMQNLQELVIKITADNVISNQEIVELKNWLENNTDLKGFYPYDDMLNLVEQIMMDGIMTADEECILLGFCDKFINPQTDKTKIELYEKKVCLSGEFIYGSKKQVEQILINRGAVIIKTVTTKLDVLIMGESGSIMWKYGNYGAKYEKALQLKEKGKSIIIVKENDVL